MHIVADDAIPWLHEAFSEFGEIHPVRGRAMQATMMATADILLTRSVTRVDEVLLSGSAVRWVGSSTSGVDHVDRDVLVARGIDFAHAPGCNANAVVEYVLSAIAWAVTHDAALAHGTIGVVGYGEVGSRLCVRLRALGRDVLACDPPRRQAGLDHGSREPLHDLDTLLRHCNILTLHVPMTLGGPHGTHHLIDAQALARLPSGSLIINTSRGAVVDSGALEAWLDAGRGYAILDVWEHEPQLRWSLMDRDRLLLATPHVAGYTLEGKVVGTRMVHDALARYMGRAAFFSERALLGPPGSCRIEGPRNEWEILRVAHPLDVVDGELRGLQRESPERRPHAFEQLRRDYPLRRELSHFALAPHASAELRALGERLGVGTPVPDARPA